MKTIILLYMKIEANVFLKRCFPLNHYGWTLKNSYLINLMPGIKENKLVKLTIEFYYRYYIFSMTTDQS